MTQGSFPKHWDSALLQRALIALAAIVGFSFVGMAVANDYYFFFILLALFAFSVMAISAQEKMIFPIITACFLASYGTWLFGLPSNTIYVIHLMIFALVAAIFLKKVINRDKGVYLNAFVLVWMVFLVALFFVNSSIGIFSLQKLISFFLYPLLFFAVLNIKKGEQFDKRVISFLLFFVALQFPVVIVQKIIYWNVNPDRVGGTLRYAGGTTLMAVLMSQFWCFVLAYFLLSKKQTIAQYVLLLLPFIPLALGNANAGFLFTMGSGIIVYGVYFFLLKIGGVPRKITRLVVILFPILSAYIFLTYLLPQFDPKFDRTSWSVISSIDGIMGHTTGYQKQYRNSIENTPAYRFEQIKVVASITKDIYFGNGIGFYSDSPLLGLSNNALPQTYKLALSWATSFVEFFLETGIVGVLLYIAAIFSFIAKALIIVLKSMEKFWMVYGLGFIGMAAVITVSSLYNDSWRAYPVAGSFWICAAIIERVYRRMRIPGKFPDPQLRET